MMNVFISRKDRNVEHLFQGHGFTIVSNIYEADLVVFTGGADVNPALYNEPNTASHIDTNADRVDLANFNEALSYDLPMMGICRGAQFLNVMNGGKMVQHVEDHSGSHYIHTVLDARTGEAVEVTSTHHQQMDPSFGFGDCELIALASHDLGYEVVKYEDHLCFQPHPEYGHRPTEDYFFYLLETELGIK